jgi:hypothetical protein
MAVILFVVHPVHVEAVASLVGRADMLCGLLYATSLTLYLRSYKSESKPKYILDKGKCSTLII